VNAGVRWFNHESEACSNTANPTVSLSASLPKVCRTARMYEERAA
jgi:hypothetical protein